MDRIDVPLAQLGNATVVEALAALQAQWGNMTGDVDSVVHGLVETNRAAFSATLLGAAYLVLFMQAGFSMLERGTVHLKNTQAILAKNIVDVCVGVAAYWTIGRRVANAAMVSPATSTEDIFSIAFCSTAATIVSGAVAERMKLGGYVVVTFFLTAFAYPLVVNFAWGQGWLYELGYVGPYPSETQRPRDLWDCRRCRRPCTSRGATLAPRPSPLVPRPPSARARASNCIASVSLL